MNVVASNTSWSEPPPTVSHLNGTGQTLASLFYGIGVSANALALALLWRHEKRSKRQALLLRLLATSDLLALLGSWVIMQLQLAFDTPDDHILCAVRVAWRAVGLGSGAVAAVMAAERFLALTRPFFYQKHVTVSSLRRSVMFLWGAVCLVVALPFMGIGLYYDDNRPIGQRCVRYRYATEPKDVAYAYIFFTFGVLLCSSIVFCNLGVMKVLCSIDKRRYPRRLSRASSLSSSQGQSQGHNLPGGGQATKEEVAFARLMGVLSVAFVACWLPTLIIIIFAQADPLRRNKAAYRIGDIAVALNFLLDPFLYVVLRVRARKTLWVGVRKIFRFCKRTSKPQSSDQNNGAVEKQSLNKGCISSPTPSELAAPSTGEIPLTPLMS